MNSVIGGIVGGIVGSYVPVVGTTAGAKIGAMSGNGSVKLARFAFDNDYRDTYRSKNAWKQGIADTVDIAASGMAAGGVASSVTSGAATAGMNAAGTAVSTAAEAGMNTAAKQVAIEAANNTAVEVGKNVGTNVVTNAAAPSLSSQILNIGYKGLQEVAGTAGKIANENAQDAQKEQQKVEDKRVEKERNLSNMRDISPNAVSVSPLFTDPSMFGMSDRAKKNNSVSSWYKF